MPTCFTAVKVPRAVSIARHGARSVRGTCRSTDIVAIALFAVVRDAVAAPCLYMTDAMESFAPFYTRRFIYRSQCD